jgi:hypothetical protein
MVASSAASKGFLDIWIHPFKAAQLPEWGIDAKAGVHQDKHHAVHQTAEGSKEFDYTSEGDLFD